jgi:5,10-methylenetetrahydromethanopterin reductase
VYGLPNTTPVPPSIASGVAAYVELARGFRPQGAHYLENHRGYLMFVKPEERPFAAAELIRQTTITATEPEIKERIAALFAAGYTEIAIQMVPGQEHAIKDWGKSAVPSRNSKSGRYAMWRVDACCGRWFSSYSETVT